MRLEILSLGQRIRCWIENSCHLRSNFRRGSQYDGVFLVAFIPISALLISCKIEPKGARAANWLARNEAMAANPPPASPATAPTSAPRITDVASVMSVNKSARNFRRDRLED